jgi:hypothetical protein
MFTLVVKALCCKPEGRRFETGWGEWISSVYLILPAALGPAVYSACNRNEYQKQGNNVPGRKARPVRRADSLATICEPISRQLGTLNISQPCSPPQPGMGIALLFVILPKYSCSFSGCSGLGSKWKMQMLRCIRLPQDPSHRFYR